MLSKLVVTNSDFHRTPIAMTDDSGTVVWSHRFSPFEESLELNEDPDNDGESISLNLRFPGQYYDAESGLHYNWWRYYEPGTGLFLSADQMTSVSEMVNLWRMVIANQRNTGSSEELSFLQQPALQSYIYTGGNPLLFIDPTGFWYIDICLSFYAWNGWSIGFQFNPVGGYFYLGSGHGLGAGLSVSFSMKDPTLGRYRAIQGGYQFLCMQVGWDHSSWYTEGGLSLGYPQTSVSFGTYTGGEWFKWSDFRM